MIREAGDRVALVTGAGRRVGRVIAEALARCGYSVAVHAHHSFAAAQELVGGLEAGGHAALAVRADLANEESAHDMVDRVHAHFHRIDALVNSAAIWQPGRLEDVTAKDVRRHFELNTLGTFLCCQRVGLIMVDQASGGAIVNIGDWAVCRPYQGYSAYFPSKATIPTMTRMFAVELGRRNPNVRVNAVLPGPVMLPDDLPEEQRQAAIDATLVRREGRPEHVAHAVQFLLENDFVTGVSLPVDGGRTAYAPDADQPTS
jgi:pteridine reductase